MWSFSSFSATMPRFLLGAPGHEPCTFCFAFVEEFNPSVSVLSATKDDAGDIIRWFVCVRPVLELPKRCTCYLTLNEIGLFEDSNRGESSIGVEDHELVVIILKDYELLCWIQSVSGNVSTEIEQLVALLFSHLRKCLALAVW